MEQELPISPRPMTTPHSKTTSDDTMPPIVVDSREVGFLGLVFAMRVLERFRTGLLRKKAPNSSQALMVVSRNRG
jgi:hypothetical protein